MIKLRLQSLTIFFISFFSRETFNSLTNWLTDARTLASPNIVIILVGNKKDLDADREVTFLEASRFAQENGTKKTYSNLSKKCAALLRVEKAMEMYFYFFHSFISTNTLKHVLLLKITIIMYIVNSL